MKDQSVSILSDITVHAKYAKFIPEIGRRETWEEICERNMAMHLRRYPQLRAEIQRVYRDFVIPKKVLPSMRSMQFGGRPIELTPSRIFNCAFGPVDHLDIFSEAMFLLLGGTGLGFSVQRRHTDCLPLLQGHNGDSRRFVVGDSIEGWADAVKVLVEAYFHGKANPVFDYSDIRPKGAQLVTSGGKAPGPEPLARCIEALRGLLDRVIADRGYGTRLEPIEAHDMMCHIADAVLAGGIRRAALISLFDRNDEAMLTAKSGAWWEHNPQRGRANNSAVLPRGRVTREEFDALWAKVEASGAGEPGVYWNSDPDWGTNPCCLAGDSMILTAEGYVPLATLANGQEHDMINVRGEVVKGTAWATGEKPVLVIKAGNTRHPLTIRATADHRFMLADGSTVEAGDLQGERIMPFYRLKDAFDVDVTRYGFVFGDGCFRKETEGFKNVQVSFTPGNDDEVAALFRPTGWSTDKTTYTVDVSYEEMQAFGIDVTKAARERELPNIAEAARIQDFLTGLFSANGCVVKGSRVALKTTSPEVAHGVLAWLDVIGIQGAYITTNKPSVIQWPNGEFTSRESYDVNIGRLEDVCLFAEKIGFIQTHKREALKQLILSKAPFVFSVKPDGVETVYDFNLQDDTHWGVVEGVIAHNCEIALRPNQFCNLTEVNVDDVVDQDDLNARARAGAFIGTLQAGYTDFHYLRPVWRKTTEEEALIGVGMTGIGSGAVLGLDLEEAAEVVKQENASVAFVIGINAAARTTTVKPAGTSSLVLGSASGIHAWHNDHYIRRIRVGKNEAIYGYLAEHHPELVKDEHFRPNEQAVIEVPQKAPEGAILRHESPEDLLARVKRFNLEWVRAGHRTGANTHNVSCTISVKDDEWGKVGEWMWENRDHYNGISVLPYDGGSYIQAPFSDIDAETYESMIGSLKAVDLTRVIEAEDHTDLTGEVACGAGGCEVR